MYVYTQLNTSSLDACTCVALFLHTHAHMYTCTIQLARSRLYTQIRTYTLALKHTRMHKSTRNALTHRAAETSNQ